MDFVEVKQEVDRLDILRLLYYSVELCVFFLGFADCSQHILSRNEYTIQPPSNGKYAFVGFCWFYYSVGFSIAVIRCDGNQIK